MIICDWCNIREASIGHSCKECFPVKQQAMKECIEKHIYGQAIREYVMMKLKQANLLGKEVESK